MVETPKISILIAHFNSGKYFTDAFESLRRQTETDWEVIIVDDASTDGSPDLVKSLIKNDSRFKIIVNDTNEGCAAAISRAIQYSTAPLFARLDPDDALAPEALDIMVRAHTEYPEVGLIYSNHWVCSAELEIQNLHQCRQLTNLTDEESFLYYGEIAQFATFKKEFFRKTDGMHTFNKRAEDVDIYLKMSEVAPVRYLNENLYYYRIRPGSRRQFENAERAKFWYWVALIKMAERRNLNIEDFFVKHCARRKELQAYIDREARIRNLIEGNIFLKSALKIGQKWGLFNLNKYLDK